MSKLVGWVVVSLLCCASSVRAQSEAERAIPRELQPWIDWVKTSDADRNCAFTAEGTQCAWPGQLALDLDTHGGRFALPYQMDRAGEITIVGSATRWPEHVRVDGRLAAVTERDGRPALKLDAGAHRIEGELSWQALPERLELPSELGLIALRVDGQTVPFPKREEDGSVWLGAGDSGAHEVDELSLTVTRKISDGVPLLVTTRLALRVAGRARELSLGKVNLPGTEAIALTSDLPARLAADGALRLQARAGMHSVEILARTLGSPEALAWRAPGAHWPATETWVWQANDALRQVTIAGAASIDPAHTELADDWRALPAFAVREATPLQLTTVRRGEAAPPPNRVTLSRDLWLDLDGQGYTVRDRVSAELKRDWRMSLEQGLLGRVSDGARDLLITQDPPDPAHPQVGRAGHPGVELRARSNSLLAEWRADAWRDDFPAVAWSQDVQSLEARLHLGPGWSVLAATGVDKISQSWVQDWDLFGFFFVLVVTLAFAKLFGMRMGVLALCALVLTEHESEAPHALWFVLLVGAGLLQVLPEGFLRVVTRVVFGLSAITLLIVTVIFTLTQIRLALYPQLAEGNDAYGNGFQDEDSRLAKYSVEEEAPPAQPQIVGMLKSPVPQAPPQQAAEAPSGAGGAVGEDETVGLAMLSRANGVSVSRQSLGSHAAYDRAAPKARGNWLEQDPDAVVQTGPGLPTWSHGTWRLQWLGPVDRTQRVHLWLLSPGANRVLALLRALLLSALAGLLLYKVRLRGPAAPSSPIAPTTALVLVLASLLGPAADAHAQAPSPELLEQLRARVAPIPECRGRCISLQTLDLDVDAARLRLRLEAHAGESTALAIPGPVATWSPQTLTVDGHPASAMLRADGFLLVRVPAGVHEVEALGPLPGRDSLLLAMTELPHRTHVTAQGWAVDGVRDDGQIDGSLLLSRLAKTAGDDALEGQALPEWLELERHLHFGTSWQIVSTLRRVSPIGTPVLAHIPILPGESIASAAFETKNGLLAVTLARDASEAQWTSTLKERAELSLTAAKGVRWSERWIVECSAIWRCEPSGLAPLGDASGRAWLPTFQPWPGETLKLALQKPKPAAGQSTTIDDVRLNVTPGQRIRNAVLDLRVRASRGGAHEITLGSQARVQQLSIDARERTLQQNGARLGFMLEPGSHQVHLEWQEPSPIGFVETGAYVKLDGNAVNVRTSLQVPSDRWLLWASGPAWGPAVLFWGRMLLVLMLGVMLGRTRLTPLRSWEWMLLGLGLTQIEVPLALIVVGWFFALQQRTKLTDLGRWPHNLMQLALGLWTLITLIGLYEAVQQGLLMQPNMQVAGAGSSQETLRWYSDRASGVLPGVSVWSAPIWIWRVLMLLWALWLASRCIRWLPWALSCMRSGVAWKKKEPKLKMPEPPAPAPPTVANAP